MSKTFESKKAISVLYFGELHEKIKVLNLVIKPLLTLELDDTSVNITVKKNGVTVTRDTVQDYIPFKGFTVQHYSTQTVTVVNGSEVHLRLQINLTKTSLTETHILDCHEDILTTTDQKRVLDVNCKRCFTPVTYNTRTYNRVLDLPSENWQEYLDNWCCHGNDAISKLKGGLNPQPGDCFLGNWYILVHPQVVDDNTVEINKEEDIYCVTCKRCLQVVGELDSPTNTNAACLGLSNSVSVKLYKYSVSMILNTDSEQKDIFRDFGEETYMARKLISLTKSRLCHKFIVQYPKKTNKTSSCVALLWIMNTDARFLMPCENSQSFVQDTSVNMLYAVKVLYKCYLEDNFEKTKKEWYNSQQTEITTFPLEICLQLLVMLDKNSKAQPLSMRHTNGLNTSFLKIQ